MSTTQPAQTTPRRYQLFIDGQFVDAESGKTFKSPNPATGATFAEVAEADKADVDKAVAAARKALDGKWFTRCWWTWWTLEPVPRFSRGGTRAPLTVQRAGERALGR